MSNKPKDEKALSEKILAWAHKNYNRSYGAQCLVECFDVHELGEQFDSLRDAMNWAALQEEQYQNAQDY